MKQGKIKLPNTLQVDVYYVSGQLSLEVTKATTGKELFTLVCTCLGIKEFWYFGLQYEKKEKQVCWLRPAKRVYDVVGKCGVPLFFLVKYYPEEIGKVEDTATLFFIFSQCKKEVVSGSIFCPPETSILLASYALQAQLGDWAHVNHNALDASTLIPNDVLKQYGTTPTSWAASLKEWHKDHEGLTPAESETEYMRVAQYLGMYGVSYFQGKTGGAPVWIGVNPKGINVYEDSLLIPKTSLKWVFIKMVHYNCKKFIVRPMLESLRQYVFIMKKSRAAKQLFELAVGYHHLHIRTRLLPSISIKSEDLNKEKFRETTEEMCANDVAEIPQWSRHFKKKQIYKHLPTLEEEDLTNNA